MNKQECQCLDGCKKSQNDSNTCLCSKASVNSIILGMFAKKKLEADIHFTANLPDKAKAWAELTLFQTNSATHRPTTTHPAT